MCVRLLTLRALKERKEGKNECLPEELLRDWKKGMTFFWQKKKLLGKKKIMFRPWDIKYIYILLRRELHALTRKHTDPTCRHAHPS